MGYVARSDHEGVPYFEKFSKKSKVLMKISHLITSFALCNFILIHLNSKTVTEIMACINDFSIEFVNRLDARIVTESIVLFTCIYHLYLFMHFCMDKRIESFNKINPAHKKMYVIKKTETGIIIIF